MVAQVRQDSFQQFMKQVNLLRAQTLHNLSVTKARNVRLENNTAHQFMTGHSPATELINA